MLQAHGQDAFVDLVELDQLQEVNKERQAVVYGEVLPASVFALQRGKMRRVREPREAFSRRRSPEGTHGDHQVVFDLQLVRQRQDEALAVLLALPDQEHAAAQTRVVAVTVASLPPNPDTIVDMNNQKKNRPWCY